MRLCKDDFFRSYLGRSCTEIVLWICNFASYPSIIMCRNGFHLRIYRGLGCSLLLLGIIVHNFWIERGLRSQVFLVRASFIVHHLLLFTLIRSPYKQALDLMIVLFVAKDLSHYLILVAVRDIILSLHASVNSWVGTLPRLPAVHELSILFWWGPRLKWRLIVLYICCATTATSHLINDAEPFLR